MKPLSQDHYHYCELVQVAVDDFTIAFKLFQRPYVHIDELVGKRLLALNFKQDIASQDIPFICDLRRGMIPSDSADADWTGPGNDICRSFFIYEAVNPPISGLNQVYKDLFDPKVPYIVPDWLVVSIFILNREGEVVYRSHMRGGDLTGISTEVFNWAPVKATKKTISKPLSEGGFYGY